MECGSCLGSVCDIYTYVSVVVFILNIPYTYAMPLFAQENNNNSIYRRSFHFRYFFKAKPNRESALINSSSLPHHSRLFLLFSADDDDADNKDVIGNLSPCERIDVSISYNVILSHRLLVIVGNSRELVFLYWHAICHLEVYFVVH